MGVSVTVIGNVVGEVSRRTTDSGRHRASFRIARNDRTFDPQTGAYVDRQPEYYFVGCWGPLAENVADTLHKGMPVIVAGRLRNYRQEKQVSGQSVTSYGVEIVADAVGPDLSRGVAQFRRTKSQAVVRAEERAVADALQPTAPPGMTAAGTGSSG